jgi:hypothetical protein
VYFTALGEKRGRLRVSGLLAKVLMTSGLYQEALAMLLTCKEDLMEVGDATLFAPYVGMISACYMRLGQREEAKVSEESIEAMLYHAISDNCHVKNVLQISKLCGIFMR